MSVAAVPLGEVAQVERCTVQPDAIEGSAPYVGLEHITGDGELVGVERAVDAAIKSNKFAFDSGHVLYGKLRPYLAKITAPDFDGVCSTDILPVRPGPHVDRRYLLHVLRLPPMVAHASRLAVGANLPRLSPKSLATFPIPLPPMEQQQRIAAALDAADELRAKRREALAKLDTLTQTIFIDMFGDPATNETPLVPLGELVRAPITRGIDQPGPDVVGGVPYLKTTDFGRPDPHRDGLTRASPEIAARFPRSVVAAGDTVICIRATVGPTVYITDNLAGVNLSRGTARVSPSSDVLPKFLFAAMNSLHFQRQVEAKLRGATFLQIPLKELKRLRVPLPPLTDQQRLVDAVESIEAHGAKARVSCAQLDDLKASLQQRVIRGEL